MAAQSFPPLKPSSRSYSPGAFPRTEFKALNGVTTVVRFSNRRSDSDLKLGFTNIPDASAAQVLKLYEQTMVSDDWILFTSSDAAVGAGAELVNYIREVGASGLRWRFAEPPSVESVLPGISSLQCRFVGRLDPA